MNLDRDRLRLLALVVAGGIFGAVLLVVVIKVILTAIASMLWAFVVTPGGIVFLVLFWKWMSLQEARTRKRKRS